MDIRVPFILVTATVSEEYAVNIMKEGAADYILKDRLQRLPNAIWNAIEKMEMEARLSNQIILQKKLIAETGIQAQEQVRESIGTELHDNINQVLATSKLYLEHAIRKEELNSTILRKSLDTIVLAIEQIRQLSHSLVAPSLGDVTLVSALSELIGNIHLTKSVQLELIVNDFDEKFADKKMKLMFYRIVQEQINNILKHSKAKNVFVHLSTTKNQHVLMVRDDGMGFDTTKKTKGIGFRNIKNRVDFYDGTVTIISSPGKGCTLEVAIPIKQQEI
jgi:two-component system sensor histidine kinase UhpB